MKLHHSPTSPYVRKVMIVLRETELIDRVELVDGAGTPLAQNPGTLAANPLGKVPCLERDDGPALFDSRVICRYLDARHSGRKLYPPGPALFSTLTLEALADGLIDAAVLAVYEARLRPEEMRFAPWVEAQRGKIGQALDALEGRWTAHLAGPIDAGAIAVAAACGYLDLRFEDMGWRDGRPRLADWHARFAERESYRASAPA